MRRVGARLTAPAPTRCRRRSRQRRHGPAVLGWRMPLSVAAYDLLEGAIARGTRLALRRRGTEYVVIPERLRLVAGREQVLARHPTTGHTLELWVDDLDGVEAVR